MIHLCVFGPYLRSVLGVREQRARKEGAQSPAQPQAFRDARQRDDGEQNHSQERLLGLALRHQQEEAAQHVLAFFFVRGDLDERRVRMAACEDLTEKIRPANARNKASSLDAHLGRRCAVD